MTLPGDSARWERISRLFERGIDLDAAGRSRLLARECADDPALRAELERMFAADALPHALDQGAMDAVLAFATEADHPGADPQDEAPGTRLGPWRLEHVLGRGGMGTVHAARRDDDDVGQRAAIKRLHRRWDGSLQAQRFLQERRILAVLAHPNIPHLVDHGLDEQGRPWFALEYVDGTPLNRWADAQRLGLEERIALFGQVCDAVQYAHAHFVVHRDLKPDNILVDAAGHPKVLDFGVAKRMDDLAGQTGTGLMAGFTPEYAAPEQVSNGPVSASTDVYALGIVLFQLLAGRLPYRVEQDNLRQAAEAIATRAPERLDRALVTGDAADVAERMAARRTDPATFRRFARGDLSRILETALAKEPSRRYATVQAFADDLQRLLDRRPVSVTGDTVAYRARKFVDRNRWGVALASLLVLAVAAGAGGMAMKSRETQREAVRANAEAAKAQASATRARDEAKRAVTEATRARASRDFLASVLAEASPEKNNGKDTSVRQVLDKARGRITTELADQPELRVETMTLIASTYADLTLYAEGRSLLEEAVQVADANPSIAASVRARAHAEYAYSLLSDSRAPDAQRQAEAAVALLAGEAPGDDLVSALGTLGTAHYLQEDFEAALQAQQRAAEITAATQGRTSDAYAEALLELGYFLDAANHEEEAVASARQALALLEASRSAPDASRPALTRALWSLGGALSSAGRDAEALPVLERARDMVAGIYGKDTLKYARSLQLLGVAELGAGALDSARDDLSATSALFAELAPQHPLATIVDVYRADVLVRSGRPQDAVPVLESVLRRLQVNRSNALDRVDAATVLLARARNAMGNPTAARALLQPAIEDMRARRSKQLGRALVASAEASRRLGDMAGARASLDAAAPLFTAHSLPMRRVELLLERAHLAVATHDAAGRVENAQAARALLEHVGAVQAPEFAEAGTLAR